MLRVIQEYFQPKIDRKIIQPEPENTALLFTYLKKINK